MAETHQKDPLQPREKKRFQIQVLFNNGFKVNEIAQELDVSRSTVYKWAKKDSIRDEPRTGRPTKLTPTTKKRIDEEMKDKLGTSARECARVLNFGSDYKARKKKISATTVVNYLHTQPWGRSYKIKKTTMLSRKNISDRLQFIAYCDQNGYLDPKSRGKVLRANILFTDESPVLLHPEPNRQNLRIRTEDPQKVPELLVPKFSLKVMVAGGITAKGVTKLHVTDGSNINGSYYRKKILPIYFEAKDNGLFSLPRKATFMQDGAPAHSTNENLSLIRQKFPTVWAKGLWPGNSPDFNPVEHCWSKLQESVFIEPRPTNRESLIARIENVWYSQTEADLEKLVEGFRTALLQSKKRGGLKADN